MGFVISLGDVIGHLEFRTTGWAPSYEPPSTFLKRTPVPRGRGELEVVLGLLTEGHLAE